MEFYDWLHVCFVIAFDALKQCDGHVVTRIQKGPSDQSVWISFPHNAHYAQKYAVREWQGETEREGEKETERGRTCCEILIGVQTVHIQVRWFQHNTVTVYTWHSAPSRTQGMWTQPGILRHQIFFSLRKPAAKTGEFGREAALACEQNLWLMLSW